MVRCTIPYCLNSSTITTGVTYHRIPNRTKLRDKWMRIVLDNVKQGPTTDWMGGEIAIVCSVHFLHSDFKDFATQQHLKPNAVPSVFPDTPSSPELTPTRRIKKKNLLRKNYAKRTGKPYVREIEIYSSDDSRMSGYAEEDIIEISNDDDDEYNGTMWVETLENEETLSDAPVPVSYSPEIIENPAPLLADVETQTDMVGKDMDDKIESLREIGTQTRLTVNMIDNKEKLLDTKTMRIQELKSKINDLQDNLIKMWRRYSDLKKAVSESMGEIHYVNEDTGDIVELPE